MASGDTLSVAVFGRFKAGKSSLINSLIGQDVLPTGVTPITSVITRLRYGPREMARALFLDGSDKIIRREEIMELVSEGGNPDNRKGVAVVEVELPVLSKCKELQFVDTPGLGIIFTHNSRVTGEWVPQTAAAILAISADQPLSREDMALLEELRRFSPPRILILLTKIDLLSEAEAREVQAFVQAHLRDLPVGEIDLLTYTTRENSREAREHLDSQFIRPLLHERTTERSHILRHKMGNLLNDLGQCLQVAPESSLRKDENRQRLKDLVAREMSEMNIVQDEIRLVARNSIEKARAAIVAGRKTRNNPSGEKPQRNSLPSGDNGRAISGRFPGSSNDGQTIFSSVEWPFCRKPEKTSSRNTSSRRANTWNGSWKPFKNASRKAFRPR